jgi:protein-S-isoprenylcysteine O-methyltransferase Ste14
MSSLQSKVRWALISYLVAYALIHSILASLHFKRLAWLILGPGIDRWYTKSFGIQAAVGLLPLEIMLLLFPGKRLYVAPSPWRWIMILGQFLVGYLTIRSFKDAPHRFLVKAQLSKPGSADAKPLGIKGVYCWIRDPFLLSGLLQIWLTPFMTSNLLIVYALTTVYLFLGSLHWEKRLLSQFGQEYRKYQKQVPRLLPWKNFCSPKF